MPLTAHGLRPFCATHTPPQIYTLVLCAGLGGLLFGYDSSDIAIALPVRGAVHAPPPSTLLHSRALRHGARSPAAQTSSGTGHTACVFPRRGLTLNSLVLQFIERTFPSVATSNALKEAIVSVTTLGAAFGAFTGGFFSDYYGRCAHFAGS